MRLSVRSSAPSLVVAAVLVLAGCSSGSSGDQPAPSATPTPTGLTAAAWADGVCVALGTLTTDLRSVADGLSVQLGSGDALKQLETQLGTNVATAGASLDDLKAAIAQAPDTTEATTLKNNLESSASDVSTATQAARDAAQKAADASSVAGFLGSAGTALTATSAALASAKQYAAIVLTAASNAGGTLQSAFAGNASCTALKATS